MKKIIIACITLLLIALIAAGTVLREKYVYFDNKFYEIDVKELYVSCKNKFSITELNRCTNLEWLTISDIDNRALEKMRIFDNLSSLDIFHSESEINGSGIEKINMLPNLKVLLFTRCEFDLSSIRNESLEKISIILCDVTDSDLKGIANCSSLNELSLTEITMNNCFIVTDDKDFIWGRYALTDSSCLSGLDSIEKLTIRNTFIEDISGIEDMDSLNTFTVTKGYISEDYIKALEDEGITVIQYTNE